MCLRVNQSLFCYKHLGLYKVKGGSNSGSRSMSQEIRGSSVLVTGEGTDLTTIPIMIVGFFPLLLKSPLER